jgi:hypothetical protein
VIGRALPPGARVAEITLTDDEIALRVESPTPAVDGRPPLPYGDETFDEYGIAQTDWWYPREDPGLGYRQGQGSGAGAGGVLRGGCPLRAGPAGAGLVLLQHRIRQRS